MSRRFDYFEQRNRFAVLLATLRGVMGPTQYRALIRFQQLSDRWVRRMPAPPAMFALWVAEWARLIDSTFESLEEHRLDRSTLSRFHHLFAHFFRLRG
jgi:hypothetical protein